MNNYNEQHVWDAIVRQSKKINFLTSENNELLQLLYKRDCEIEKLKYELNNSNNFHCQYFLTNESGTISCQMEKK